MGSSKAIWLGLLASLLLIFLCVFFNAEKLYSELEKPKEMEVSKVVVQEEPVKESVQNVLPQQSEEVVKEEVVSLVPALFSYRIDNDKVFIAGEMSEADSNDALMTEIEAKCQDKECVKELTFSKERGEAPWKKFVSSIINFFHEQNVPSASLSINGDEIKIEGELANQEGKDKFNALLSSFGEFNANINDLTTIKVIAAEVKEEAAEESTVETAQQDIDTILKDKQVNFGLNSGEITPDGKKVLDEVIGILKNMPEVSIEISGHTDASGDDKLNLSLSQMRADAVKEYLLSNGIENQNISAEGYGETTPLLPNDTYNRLNRRVEIHLKRN